MFDILRLDGYPASAGLGESVMLSITSIAIPRAQLKRASLKRYRTFLSSSHLYLLYKIAKLFIYFEHHAKYFQVDFVPPNLPLEKFKCKHFFLPGMLLAEPMLSREALTCPACWFSYRAYFDIFMHAVLGGLLFPHIGRQQFFHVHRVSFETFTT